MKKNDNELEGLLISFDGIDSSGKETQARRLEQNFNSLGYTVGRFATPDYTTPSGKKLKALFQGVDGSWNDLSWQEKMKLIAANRMEHKDEVLDVLARGGVVIYDRYVPSSIAHMTADSLVNNLASSTRASVARIVEQLEYVYNGMPKESLSIFLDVPPRVACRLLENRKTEQMEPDEATDELALQERIYNEYQLITASDPQHFVKINCCADDRLLAPDDITKKVWQAVQAKFPQLKTKQ